MSTQVWIQSSFSSVGSASIGGATLEVGNILSSIDVSFPSKTNNLILDRAFKVADLKAFLFLSSQTVTLSTNGQDEVQRLSMTGTPPTTGQFTLTFMGETTPGLQFNASAGDIQTALEALSTIGLGNVQCSGGPLPDSPVNIAFTGSLGCQDVALITTTDYGLDSGSSAINMIVTAAPVDQTLILNPGDPFLWKASSGYYPCPFTVDVTRLLISSEMSARVQGGLLF